MEQFEEFRVVNNNRGCVRSRKPNCEVEMTDKEDEDVLKLRAVRELWMTRFVDQVFVGWGPEPSSEVEKRCRTCGNLKIEQVRGGSQVVVGQLTSQFANIFLSLCVVAQETCCPWWSSWAEVNLLISRSLFGVFREVRRNIWSDASTEANYSINTITSIRLELTVHSLLFQQVTLIRKYSTLSTVSNDGIETFVSDGAK